MIALQVLGSKVSIGDQRKVYLKGMHFKNYLNTPSECISRILSERKCEEKQLCTYVTLRVNFKDGKPL